MRGKLRRKENGTHGWSAMIFALALAAACFIAVGRVEAERTRFWKQSSFEEFDRGTAKGVALRSDGLLMLAPKLTEAEDPNAAYLWTLRADSKGNLYAGGGTNAKVVKYDAAGRTTTVFESQELAAQALAVDAQGNLYVGTSPDGKVYKVTTAGEKSTFFEPKTKYIWDLAVASDGTLYVATGDKGGLYAVAADGKGELIYSSEETHMRSLAFDGKGNLLIGTDPSGLILRLEPASGGQARPAKAGKAPAAVKTEMRAFVVYETARKEVTSLVTDASGNLFAAAMGLKARTPTAAPTTPATLPPVQPTQPGQPGQTPTTQTQRPPTQAPAFFPTAGGSAVYRIGPDGEPKELWSSNTELVYTVGIGPDGKLLLGTGNDGRVVRLEGPNLFARVAKTSAAQVTGIAAGPGGKMFLCTANPGKVLTLGPETEAEGTFESQVYDARIFSEWGRLAWWGENGATDGAVALYARSGNTSNAEKNWSMWAGPFAGGMSEPVGSPAARFAQWKAVLKNVRGAAPTISWVSLAYLPRNVAPEIERIAMQEAGVRAQGFQPQSSGGGQQQPVQLRPPTRAPSGTAGTGLGRPQVSTLPQGFRAKGWQAVLWSARDENDDELTFAIYFRGEGEKNWKLLKDEIAQTFYSWDATTLPDGAYTLKIEASDAATNPREGALKGWLESERFEVDNTPPQISGLSAVQEGQGGGNAAAVRVKFGAMDATSVIERAEYSVDGGEWKMVYPTGRLSDARTEHFDFVLRGVEAGEHTVAVRVFDAFENTASAKVTMTVK